MTTQPNDDLKVKAGDTDSYGEKVSRVFDRVDGKYIIYETESAALRCHLIGGTPQQNELLNRAVTAVDELIAGEHKLAKRYNTLRALGVGHWFRGDLPHATAVFEDIQQSVLRRLRRQARLLYISGSMVVVVVTLVSATVAAYFSSRPVTQWCLVGLFGALGAFVSLAIRRGDPSTLDVLEDRRATLLYGAVRALVAIIFAAVMYLLVLGGVLLPEIAHGSVGRLLVVAFIAGFSEKLVPEALIHQAVSGGAHA